MLILVDADQEPCEKLKARIVKAWKHCAPNLVALVRIAVEETEAFFLGDFRAIKVAYPHARKAKWLKCEQDGICGTWEVLRHIHGEPPDSEDKITWAERIGAELRCELSGRDANRSPSLRQFGTGLLRLVGAEAERRPKRRVR